jgi:histone deacetylase complex regulatory component SIN3
MNLSTKFNYTYLDHAKTEFGHHPQVHNEFLHIMRTFKSQEIDIPEVIFRVTQLFHYYHTFLPDGFEIVIPNHDTGSVYYRTAGQPLVLIPTSIQEYDDRRMQEQKEQEEQEEEEQENNAFTYMNDIKRTFANDPDVYNTFLGILDSYSRKQCGIQEVLEEVFVLFAGHPVLLRDFAYFFLPDDT